MIQMKNTNRLIAEVGARRGMTALGAGFHLWFCIVSTIFLLVLLVSRLLGVVPDIFDVWSLMLLPGLAIAMSIVFRRRLSIKQIAREIDDTMQTEDLFLTSALIENTPGAYQAIVVEQAEQRACTVDPAKVVPYGWLPYARNLTIILIVLTLGVLFLPQLDPFGKVEEGNQRAQEQKTLEESRKITDLRKEQLKTEQTDQKLSPAVQNNLDAAVKQLQQMKKEEQAENLRKLMALQKGLGADWREKRQEMLKNLLSKKPMSQQFGLTQEEIKKFEKFQEELMKGDSRSLRREIEDLKELAQQAESAEDQRKREESIKELQRRLQQLANAAEKGLGGKDAQDALKRALQQLEAANTREMPQGFKDAINSMDLAGMEMDKVAQMCRDSQSLQDALDALKDARSLNEMGKLQGSSPDLKGMEDYAKMYEQMMAGEGQGGKCGECGGGGCGECGGTGLADGNGQGKGTGKRGQGGGKVDEAEAETDFKREVSESRMQPGKMLMSWKTKGVAEAGEVKKDFTAVREDVKMSVDEAILRERIPPGYHESIQGYFDSMAKGIEAREE